MNAAGIFSATGGRKRMAMVLMVALFAIAPAFAINFPALTGRVVDQANIIQPDTRAAIEQRSADLEEKSGIQLVVATVNSLEGQEIEPYANELFRKWALGEKKKNNGVLMLVAPNERRVRIEVGYGLEGTLTDALSKVIISNAMTPRFKAGNFSEGRSARRCGSTTSSRSIRQTGFWLQRCWCFSSFSLYRRLFGGCFSMSC